MKTFLFVYNNTQVHFDKWMTMTCATLLLPSITLCCSIYPKYKSWTFFPFWDQPSSPLHHHIIAALLLVFIICGWETLFKFFLLWVYLNDKVSLPHVVTQWHRYHNDDVGSWEVPYLDHVHYFNCNEMNIRMSL